MSEESSRGSFKVKKGGKASRLNAYLLALAIVIAGAMVAGAIVATNEADDDKEKEVSQGTEVQGSAEVAADDDLVMGQDSAPIEIIEFSDYRCYYCAKFHQETLPKIKEEYIDSGKVKYIHRDAAFMGENSRLAAMAVECAEDEGKKWDLQEVFFADTLAKKSVMNADDLKRLAGQAGVKTREWQTCFDEEKYGEEVDKDTADAKAAGVSGTPTFFINGKSLVGAQPYESFKGIIDNLLED